MSDGIDVRFLEEGEPLELNQFWRCPKCGTEMAAGKLGTLISPKCCRVEMEQITAEGFGREGSS